MRDSRTGASGLAHIVLPVSNGADLLIPAKYADTAVPALMRGLLASGCTTREIKAKLAGGAKLLREGSFDGYENVESTRNELSKNGITIIAEDVGSTYGRSVKFDTSTGNMMIKRYHQFHGMVELKDEIII
jgi:chemotaxis protein CheD